MASVGYATLSVIPSAKGFGKQLASDVDPQLDETGRSSGARFGRVLGGAAVAAAGLALAGIGAVLRTGIDEAMDASGGIAQLEAGIKSTGGVAGVTVDHLTDLAGALQNMSGQTDDSIVAAEQLLLTFTNIRNTDTADIFDQATLATTNMAAKLGGDASSNAVILGKALNDPIGGISALTRAGIQFTDDQKAVIESLVATGDMAGAQSIILAELNTQFGGAAEAAGKSLPGQLEIAKRKFEDISQTIAEKLIPVVMPALAGIADFITEKVLPAVSDFIQGFKDGTGIGGAFRDVYDKVATTISTVAGYVRDAVDYLTPFVQRFADMFEQARSGKGDLEAVSGALEFAKTVWSEISILWNETVYPALHGLWVLFNENVVPVLQDVTEKVSKDLGPALSDLADFISAYVMPVVKFFFDAWVNGAAIFISKVLPVLASIGGWIATYIIGYVETGIWVVSNLIEVFQLLGNKVSRVADTIKGVFKGVFNGIAQMWNDTIGGLSFTIPDIKGLPGRGQKIAFPDIPMLDKGGLVTSPTLAMIGERRPEVVIPLAELDKYTGGKGSAGHTFHIYEASNYTAIAQEVIRRLQLQGAGA